MSDRWEWVEIIEPRTKERMYANLTTGECVWDPPPGVRIKKTDNNQWWELFDQNTSRFYYYNASLQKTAWHRPTNCDIIPLAKLQTLKQNTEVSDRPRPVRKEISTQTPAGHAHAKRGLDLQTSHSCQTSPHQTARHHSRSHNRSQRHNQASTSSPLQQDQTRFQPNVADNNERPGRSFHHKPKSTNSNSNAYPFYDNASGSPRHPCDEAISQRMSPDVNPAFDISKQFELPVKSTGTDGLCSGRGQATADQQVPFHSPPHVRHHPAFFVRQGSFPFATYDDPSDYFGDLTGQQQNTALITAVQVTPRPKPRAFPRTNPAYVGMHRHDGAQAYKKVGVEQQVQQQPATAVYNQYFYDLNSQLLPYTGHSSSSSQGYPGDFVDRRKFRHEQSDSDTSHSSFGISRLHQADVNDGTGQSGMSARPIFRRDQFSDSLSSQGSLRGRPDLHSSQGSLGFHDKDCMTATSPLDSLSSHSSPRHIVPEIDHVAPYQQSYQVASGFRDRFKQDFVRPEEVAGVRARRNSEPDYANLPAISQARSNKEEVLQRERREKTAPSFALATEEPRSGDSLPSADSLSPTEFTKRQDTPSSVRSGSTHHSIASHTSEGLPDQGFEDSDNSSLFSSPSPKDRHRHNHSSLMPSQTQHPSLLRRKMLEKLEKVEMEQSAMENSLSLEVDLVRPLSLLLTSQSEEDLSNNLTSSDHRMMAIEQFAMENLNEHRRGLLGKTVPIGNMLTWTKDIISKPMIRTNDKIVKKEAPEVFKLIQMYMGDRKAKTTSIQVALEIVTKGWSLVELRDEIFIQLSRQTCQNPRDESLMHGWELLGVCLSIFPPSYRFHSYLEGYIYRNLDPVSDTEKVPVSHFAAHCQRRLDRIVKSGAKRGLRKPTVDEIEQALKSIFHPSMFGNTLDEVMLMQKERCPDRQLPWIQTTLSEEVLHLNGAQTEGIFRVPGDIDEVNTMKALCDQWNPPTNCSEPHSPASLLKLWYRELYEPLIPPEFYEQCVNNYSDSEAAIGIVNSLPHINRLVLSYLIRFLQVFAAPANASVTKMDASNLAMVMAPNCLRCESDDPSVIFENTRKEMAFIRTLIQNLDTSFMDGVI